MGTLELVFHSAVLYDTDQSWRRARCGERRVSLAGKKELTILDGMAARSLRTLGRRCPNAQAREGLATNKGEQ